PHFVIVVFFQAEDGIRDRNVTGVQTCALPISLFLSYGSLKSISSSKSFTLTVNFSTSSDSSCNNSSSFSSLTISYITSASSICSTKASNDSTLPFNQFVSLITFCAASWSSQKPGSVIFCSNS